MTSESRPPEFTAAWINRSQSDGHVAELVLVRPDGGSDIYEVTGDSGMTHGWLSSELTLGPLIRTPAK